MPSWQCALVYRTTFLKPVNPQEFAQTIEKVTAELQKQNVENEQRLQQSSYMREYLLYTLFNGGGAEQCIHWQEILQEKISGIISTGLYF